MKTSSCPRLRQILNVDGFEPPFHEIARHFIQPGVIVEVNACIHPFLSDLTPTLFASLGSFVPYWVERSLRRSDLFAEKHLNLRPTPQGKRQETFQGWQERVLDHPQRFVTSLMFVSTIARRERINVHQTPCFYGVAEGRWQHPSGDVWESWHRFVPVGSPPLEDFRGLEKPLRFSTFEGIFNTMDHRDPESAVECLVEHSLTSSF